MNKLFCQFARLLCLTPGVRCPSIAIFGMHCATNLGHGHPIQCQPRAQRCNFAEMKLKFLSNTIATQRHTSMKQMDLDGIQIEGRKNGSHFSHFSSPAQPSHHR